MCYHREKLRRQKMDEQAVKQFRDYIIEAGRRNREQKYEKFRRLNAFCEKGQILFTGSSLMEYFPVVEMTEGMTEKKVYNRGVGARLPLSSSIISMRCSSNIGTNDLSRPDYSHEGLKERYRFIFTQIAERLPDTKVYFMAFYPMNEAKMSHPMAFGLRTNELTTEANAAVKEVCAEFSFVEYLDCNEGLRDEAGRLKEEFAIDGVHMWPEAYALVLEALKPYLEAL